MSKRSVTAVTSANVLISNVRREGTRVLRKTFLVFVDDSVHICGCFYKMYVPIVHFRLNQPIMSITTPILAKSSIVSMETLLF